LVINFTRWSFLVISIVLVRWLAVTSVWVVMQGWMGVIQVRHFQGQQGHWTTLAWDAFEMTKVVSLT
jgi:hypothetical protein